MKTFLKIVVILLLLVACVAAWLGMGMDDVPEVRTVTKEIEIQ